MQLTYRGNAPHALQKALRLADASMQVGRQAKIGFKLLTGRSQPYAELPLYWVESRHPSCYISAYGKRLED